MNLIEQKKVFFIDSKKRLNPKDSHSNFSFKLPITQEDEFDSCCVLQMQIPKSYYLVREGQNVFYLFENNAELIMRIPPGNYSRRSFQNTVQNLLNENSLNLFTYEVIYPDSKSADTGKFTFRVTMTPVPADIKLKFGNYLYEQFGFDANSENLFVNNQLIGTLVSKNVIKLQLEDTIYLRSDITQNKEGNNILQEVYCANGEPSYSNIYYSMVDLEANSKDMVESQNYIY